jgi:hypothetical protein
MQIILGLIVAALTWFIIFFLMDLVEYIIQEIKAEWRKFCYNCKRAWLDFEWALKH